MKKTIKPFDLEAAKNGAKVETRDGRPVRILDYNIAGNPYSIVGAVPEHPIEPPSFCNPEEVRTWTKEGMNRNDLVESPQDLVIVEYKDEEIPELGGIMAKPELVTGFQHETKANSDDYIIELVDCDNGIFCHIHDLNPDTEDAYLVYKHEEQEQEFGKFLLDSVRAKMDADSCNKVRIEMKIFSETK